VVGSLGTIGRLLPPSHKKGREGIGGYLGWKQGPWLHFTFNGLASRISTDTALVIPQILGVPPKGQSKSSHQGRQLWVPSEVRTGEKGIGPVPTLGQPSTQMPVCTHLV
jgi:hypothetical protein